MTRTFHILLVEDEPGDTQLMRLAMKKNNFPFILDCVSDGQEAIGYLLRQGQQFQNSQRPDLILLDLKMPGMGGLETLKNIKQLDELSGIPTIIITTSGLESDVDAAYRLGAAGYVPKPTDFNDFIDAIKILCTYWFSLVRLPKKIH